MKVRNLIKNLLSRFQHSSTLYRVTNQGYQYSKLHKHTVETSENISYFITRNILIPSVKRAFNERN